MSRPADIYLRFLRLAESIKGLPTLQALDPLEERILGLIATTNDAKERLSVRDMIAQSEFGSPTMLHRRLKSMRAKGWITLSDTEDARRKQLALTPAALKHFDSLSHCLLQAVQKGN